MEFVIENVLLYQISFNARCEYIPNIFKGVRTNLAMGMTFSEHYMFRIMFIERNDWTYMILQSSLYVSRYISIYVWELKLPYSIFVKQM